MKVVIFPAGPDTFASSRIRSYWTAKYWSGAEVHTGGPLDARGFDAFIFQKVFSNHAAEDARKLKRMDKIVAWDICEPLWWTYPEQHALMAKGVDFAVACSRNLTDLATKELGIPCHFIPDRHDPAFHPSAKIHEKKEVLRFVWFGYFGNRFTLIPIAPFLNRLSAHGKSFELMLIDEHPEVSMVGLPCRVIHKLWCIDEIHDDLLHADVALLPPHPDPAGRYKSNNKEMTASWCGLPVTNGTDWEQMCDVFDLQYRVDAGCKGRNIAQELYDVHISVREWEKLLSLRLGS